MKQILSSLIALAPLLFKTPVTISFSPAIETSFPRGSTPVGIDPLQSPNPEYDPPVQPEFLLSEILPFPISYPDTVT